MVESVMWIIIPTRCDVVMFRMRRRWFEIWIFFLNGVSYNGEESIYGNQISKETYVM